ncbi:MAG: MgtC/SapB family protein [Anaerolineales bacterium]|nr:MgtC/SapB family protein [Anaerolineales bacterium]
MLTNVLLELQMLGIMLLAMVLGGIIGFEREVADKPAGLRTHMIVAGSAAFLTSLGSIIVPQLGVELDFVQTDPIRMIEAIITGITFLGAGTIIRQHGSGEVEGLTTAASLLLVGSIGIGVALYQFVFAIGATILVLLTLRALKMLDKKI